MAFTDDPGVQRQAAAESAANIAKDLGIALERIGIKSIERLSGMQKTRRGLKCYVNQIDPDLETASEKYSRQVP